MGRTSALDQAQRVELIMALLRKERSPIPSAQRAASHPNPISLLMVFPILKARIHQTAIAKVFPKG